MGKMRKDHKILIGKPHGKRPFWRPRRRWEDNINAMSTRSFPRG
jgi:hypothetical protein